jgi:hypothetical protein
LNQVLETEAVGMVFISEDGAVINTNATVLRPPPRLESLDRQDYPGDPALVCPRC